jgi:glucosylglycerol-phosphate synthase
MPQEERRERMGALRRMVKRFSVEAWGDDQDEEFAAAAARKA